MSLSALTPHQAQSEDEASVVAAAREGDPSAFSILATTYRRKIFNKVRQITGNFEDAEDVTQQALMKAFIHIHGFRGVCSFSSWVTRIAINEALMLKRKPQAYSEVSCVSSASDESRLVPEFADARPNPEQCYDKQERHQIVIAALKRLKPSSRQALELCDLNDRSLNELATIQGLSAGAAKSRLFRSRKLLRARVRRSLCCKVTESAQASIPLA